MTSIQRHPASRRTRRHAVRRDHRLSPYPDFNPVLIHVTVIRQYDTGAEFVADRKTRIGERVGAYDRYECHQDLVVERRYEGSASARFAWTIHPVDASHSTLTIDVFQKLFYGINFTPFIQEAERRATAAKA